MPLEPHSDGENPDLIRKFKIFRQLRKQGFRDAIPDGDAGAKPLRLSFPPKSGGSGGLTKLQFIS